MPPPTTTAAKAERLLNLVIALVNTPQFRSAAWVRKNVAGYAEAPSDEAFARMFERDKNELREIGVPLQTDESDGYRIPQTEFSLPLLSFTPEETAAVGLAARLWSTTTLQSAGEQAVRKLREASAEGTEGAATVEDPGWQFADSVLQPQVRTSDPAFAPLQSATLSRRQVSFEYRKNQEDAPTRRRLQPWGLVSYRGKWYVIGNDLGRGEQRTFRLSRIVGPVAATGRIGAYRVPAGVDLLEQVRRNAEPAAERTSRLLVRPGRAVGLRRGATLVAPAPIGDPDGSDELLVPIIGLWDTAGRIAAAGEDVLVLEPDDLRAAVIWLLRDQMTSAAAPAAAAAVDG